MGRRGDKQKHETEVQIPPATASSPLAPPPPPPWIKLPANVTANILGRLGAEEILKSAEKVCTTWKKACLNPAMWRVVHLEIRDDDEREFEIMCRRAVDLSQGQLVDLSIPSFCGGLLDYVAHQCRNLRCLTLTDADAAVTDAVKKFPVLEELNLFMKSRLDGKDIEAIGKSCPLLRSFSYNQVWAEMCSEPEDYWPTGWIVPTIALTMPNLRCLRLHGIFVFSEGLELILKRCPHLETLNLWSCRNDPFLMAGDLEKRCRKQIKNLIPRQPFPIRSFGFL